MPRSLLRYWLPPLLWIAVILSASGPGLSAQHTGSFMSTLLTRLLHRPIREEDIHAIHVAIRKCGHLFEYAVLGGLFFRALRGDGAGVAGRWVATAIVLATIVAGVDEWRQSFAPGRTAAVGDVAVDACGATLAQLVIAVRNRRR